MTGRGGESWWTWIVAALAIGVVLAALPVRSRGDEEAGASPIAEAHLRVQRGHSHGVNAVAFSPDGAHVVTGGGHTALLWEVATGREIRDFAGHDDNVTAVAFSPDGVLVLTGSADGTTRLWEIATGREIRRFGEPVNSLHVVSGVAFSPDGAHVLTGGWYVRLWDVATGKEVRRFEGHTNHIRAVAFSPDGSSVLAGSNDDAARLWEATTGREIGRFVGHTDDVASVAFSPDGTKVVTGSDDETARLWDAATGEEIRRFEGHEDRVWSVAYSPDGAHVLTGSYDRTARLWDPSTGAEIRRFEGHERTVEAVAFSPDGASVLSGALGARLWKTSTGEYVRTFAGHGGWVRAVALSSDGSHLLTGLQDATVRLWDVSTGRETRRFEGHAAAVQAVAFSSDDVRAATGSDDNTARVWDATTGEEILRLVGHEDSIHAVAFSPDGMRVLTGSWDETMRLWDARTGEVVRSFEGLDALVSGVAFLPDGAHVLANASSWIIRLWDAATGEEKRRFQGHEAPIKSMVVSRDGSRLLTGSWDATARLWDTGTGDEIRRLEGHEDGVLAVALSRDGSFVLTGSEDATARLWRADTGEEVRRFEGHEAGVLSVSFAPDGRHVLTGSKDRTARWWDLKTGREVCTLVSFSDGGWAVVDPKGRFDTGDLEAIEDLHWVMSDDPLRGLSIEVFMRDYYEPRLLSRLLAGEAMPPVKRLGALNRAQPHVEIVSVEPDPKQEDALRVTVEVGSRAHVVREARGKRTVHSGVHEIRIFRDGQVVAWRDGSLDVSEGDQRIAFPGIRQSQAGGTVSFSAYAFNADGVKSRTSRRTHVTEPVAEPRMGTAYVVAFGVDVFADPRWNLSYAAGDARLYASSLVEGLGETKAWSRVVPVLLTSTVGTDRARKGDLRAVLAALAGEAVGDEAAKRIPEIGQIEEACPEDLVILAVSTHGFATDDGGFLLLPSDVAARENAAALRTSCISTDDLARWLRPVDAGEVAMIVDACQSAASVDQAGFKPGPMGSRGFGQLAWNKRMRILAASQASEYAFESRELRHGLLTHALVNEGLEARSADAGTALDGAVTLREWLRYGEVRVPALADAISTGGMAATGPRGPLRREGRPAAGRIVQRPALFDFSRPARGEVVVRGPARSGD